MNAARRGSRLNRISHKIEQHVSGDVTIVRINGDITLNKGGDVLLKDKIHSLLQQGTKKILLDLGGVSYVDSAGLGQLVQVRTTASTSGGALKLMNVTKRLKDLLVVTKLVTVFDSYDNEAEALASFGGAAKA
jgi:anti-sigma B factor antagonist